MNETKTGPIHFPAISIFSGYEVEGPLQNHQVPTLFISGEVPDDVLMRHVDEFLSASVPQLPAPTVYQIYFGANHLTEVKKSSVQKVMHALSQQSHPVFTRSHEVSVRVTVETVTDPDWWIAQSAKAHAEKITLSVVIPFFMRGVPQPKALEFLDTAFCRHARLFPNSFGRNRIHSYDLSNVFLKIDTGNTVFVTSVLGMYANDNSAYSSYEKDTLLWEMEPEKEVLANEQDPVKGVFSNSFRQTTFVWVRLQREGFHSYPNAPDDVAYLGLKHRHLFKIKVGVQVSHDDRDVEFHQMLKFLTSALDSTLELNNKSCEMLAKDIARLIQTKYGYHRQSVVEVSEDGECGATLSTVPYSSVLG